jgi:hypothetical protein
MPAPSRQGFCFPAAVTGTPQLAVNNTATLSLSLRAGDSSEPKRIAIKTLYGHQKLQVVFWANAKS